jgi:hypothetical protein
MALLKSISSISYRNLLSCCKTAYTLGLKVPTKLVLAVLDLKIDERKRWLSGYVRDHETASLSIQRSQDELKALEQERAGIANPVT